MEGRLQMKEDFHWSTHAILIVNVKYKRIKQPRTYVFISTL